MSLEGGKHYVLRVMSTTARPDDSVRHLNVVQLRQVMEQLEGVEASSSEPSEADYDESDGGYNTPNPRKNNNNNNSRGTRAAESTSRARKTETTDPDDNETRGGATGSGGVSLAGLKIPVLPESPTTVQIQEFEYDVMVLGQTGASESRLASAIFLAQAASVQKVIRKLPVADLTPAAIVHVVRDELGKTASENLADSLGEAFGTPIAQTESIRDYMQKYDRRKRDIEKSIPNIPDEVWSNMLLFQLKKKVAPKDQRSVRMLVPDLNYNKVLESLRYLYPATGLPGERSQALAAGENKDGGGRQRDYNITCRICGEQIPASKILQHNREKHPRPQSKTKGGGGKNNKSKQQSQKGGLPPKREEANNATTGPAGDDEASSDICDEIALRAEVRSDAGGPTWFELLPKLITVTIVYFGICAILFSGQSLGLFSKLPRGDVATTAAYVAGDVVNSNELSMVVDSGATSHFVVDQKWLKNVSRVSGKSVSIANGHKIPIEGRGRAVVHYRGTRYTFDAYYVPKMAQNLFSPRKVCREGGTYFENAKGCEIRFASGDRFFGLPHGDQMRILFGDPGVDEIECEALAASLSLKEHLRMHHMGHHPDCVACAQANGRRKAFAKKRREHHKEIVANERLHVDTCGPLAKTEQGNRYAFVMVDGATRWTEVYISPDKSTKSAARALEFWAKKNGPPKCVRTDNGTEYKGEDFGAAVLRVGARHETSAPYSPQQNAVVERTNGVLMRAVRSLLHGKRKSLWGYAIKCAAYARNRTASTALEGRSPCEEWRGRKPTTKHMIPFCAGILARRQEYKTKVEEQRTRGRFLYYSHSDTSPAYVYEDETGKVRESRDIILDPAEKDNAAGDETDADGDSWLGEVNHREFDTRYTEEHGCTASEDAEANSFATQAEILEECPEAFAASVTYKEATTGPDHEEWEKAFGKELQSFKDKDVYEEVDYDGSMGKLLRMKMVLVRKGDGQCKARAVVMGHPEPRSDDAFSPVARWQTVRGILCLAFQMGWRLTQADVSTAYLNAKTSGERYVIPPQHWRTPGKVWRLKRAVYGLRESGALWNQEMDSFLVNQLGFQRSAADASLYTRDGAFLLLYVDDLLLLAKSAKLEAEIRDAIFRKYACKELKTDEDGRYTFLGVKIKWGPTSLEFSQREMAEKVLKAFGHEHCRPVKSPMVAPDQTYEGGSTKGHAVTKENYRSFVGSVMYLAIGTRYDLAYAVSYLSRALDCPEEKHFRMATRLLRYIAGSKDFALKVEKTTAGYLCAFSDSNWAQPSVSGALIFLCGLPIHWHSKRQTATALSSCEAEYVAGSETHKEVMFLRNLLKEEGTRNNIRSLFGEVLPSTVVWYDNTGAMAISKTRESRRCKHIDLRWHFVRELVERKETELRYCPTARMVADIMTKALVEAKFQTMLELIRNFDYPARCRE